MNAAGVGVYMRPQNGWTHHVMIGVWENLFRSYIGQDVSLNNIVDENQREVRRRFSFQI